MDVNGTQFSDLPSCLVIEILARLPINTLLICRCVRKDWNRLYFSDASFVKLQLASSPIHFLDREVDGSGIKFGRVVKETGVGGRSDKLLGETVEFDSKLNLPGNRYKCMNSCNGLLCLTNEYNVFVGNPILGEWVSIPIFESQRFALGYSAKNNQYKILTKEDDRDSRFEIYTLGTGQWRNIDQTLGCEIWDEGGLDFNTLLHGSLHWANLFNQAIFAFDFENEKFMRFSWPCSLGYEGGEMNDMGVALGVINGCLWACFYDEKQYNVAEMWAMKEYGVEKSWTMMLSFNSYCPTKEVTKYRENFVGHIDLLFSLSEEEMLMVNDSGDKYILIFCFNTKRMEKRVLQRPPNFRPFGYNTVTAYNPSFVSIQDVARGEKVISGIEKTAEPSRPRKKSRRF